MTNAELVEAIDWLGRRLYALNRDFNEIAENLDICCDMIAEVYANIEESAEADEIIGGAE